MAGSFSSPNKTGKARARPRINALPQIRAKRRSSSGVVCNFLTDAPEFMYYFGSAPAAAAAAAAAVAAVHQHHHILLILTTYF